jgi:5-methylcytosine-specific restriction endonuclease McrA
MGLVLDRRKKPLMPCTPKRARLLLLRGRAVVHRVNPFVIRLKDRCAEDTVLQSVALKIDPGSKYTGIALAREEVKESGVIHHALHRAEVRHRGDAVHLALLERSSHRRRRRSANLRFRKPRFDHRTRCQGWLPPSLRSRVGNILTWASRCIRWVPLTHIEVERVRFDLQLLQNPEISGVEYQQGELAGWEVRSYLLLKYQYRCAYCGKGDVPFELDHLSPRSRGGTDRVSNLVLACHACNSAKGNRTAAEYGFPEVEAQARCPLKDAAMVNTTRFALVRELEKLDLPVTSWTGGRTRWNRALFGIPKTHAMDALCVGELAGVHAGELKMVTITAKGRGRHL